MNERINLNADLQRHNLPHKLPRYKDEQESLLLPTANNRLLTQF